MMIASSANSAGVVQPNAAAGFSAEIAGPSHLAKIQDAPPSPKYFGEAHFTYAGPRPAGNDGPRHFGTFKAKRRKRKSQPKWTGFGNQPQTFQAVDPLEQIRKLVVEQAQSLSEHDVARMQAGMDTGQPICIDMITTQYFNERMSLGLLSELEQCFRCLSRVKRPPRVSLTSFNKTTEMAKVYDNCQSVVLAQSRWNLEESNVRDLYGDKEKYSNIIYLCPEAEESLLDYTLKPTDVLVLSAIYQSVNTLSTALLMGAVCKRIPLREVMNKKEHARNRTITDMTLSQAFESVLFYLSNGQNWAAALYRAIPPRHKCGFVVKPSWVGMLPGEDPWANQNDQIESNETESRKEAEESKRDVWKAMGSVGDDFLPLSNTPIPQNLACGEPFPKLRRLDDNRSFPSKKKISRPTAGFGREFKKGVSPAQAYVAAHNSSAEQISPARVSPRIGIVGPRPGGPRPARFRPVRMYAPRDPGQTRFWKMYNQSQHWIQTHYQALQHIKGPNFPFPPPPVFRMVAPPRVLTRAETDSSSSEDEQHEQPRKHADELVEHTSNDEREMSSPTHMTQEMIDFFKKTMQHREERDSKKEAAEKKQLETGWFVDKDGDYIAADKADVTASNVASTSQPTIHKDKEERNKRAKELYGQDAEKIIASETLMQMQFDNEIDQFRPPVWPVIPFKL